MSLGEFGSTLNDELNRLANGGTYRDMNQMVDRALAAKQWANRENIIPYSTDTVGILNEIAGLGLDKKNWLDFNGVCNYIAGTTGLPAAAALRQVYPTTDLLTSQASYYVDATAPRYNYPGYIYLNGTSGNYISVPDETALDITGDIDVRANVAMDDWTPAATSDIIAKFKTSTTERAFAFAVKTDGKLQFGWRTSGGVETFISSTASVSFTDGSRGWIRVTLDVDNGASGNDVKFFTSTDGSTWTQLGTTVTTASTTSIQVTSTSLEIGSERDGTTANSAASFYRAQIFAGLTGTDKRLDVDLTTNVTSATFNTFTATTGQLCTINGQDVLTNGGAAGSLLPTTVGSSTAADSNDPKFLDHTGTNYVYLPGALSNSMTVPNAVSLSVTGDIDLRVYAALDNWAASAFQRLISRNSGASNLSYRFQINNTGFPVLQHSSDGTTLVTSTSSVVTGIASGIAKWIRVTRSSSTGDVKFFLSDDGTTWTQLGTTQTTTPSGIFDGTRDVAIGGDPDIVTATLGGKVFRAQIYNGIDGTKVLDVDTSVITAGNATSFTAVTGQTVTINRSTSGRKSVAVTQPTWLFGTDDFMEVNNRYMSSGTYLYLPGIASNACTVPDSAALDVTGDFDFRIKVALDDWTPSTDNSLISKHTPGWVYEVAIQNSTGNLLLLMSPDGTNLNVYSGQTTGFTDGQTGWVRVTRVSSTGAIAFFKSTDGTNWTAIGTATGFTGNINTNTAVLTIGARGASNTSRGKLFRVLMYSDVTETTKVLDANFESSITSLNQASFTESSTNAATVTINRSGSTYRSAGITEAGYLYPGATNTFTASATDFLNFGASDSFTVLAVARNWATIGTNDVLVSKKDSTTNTVRGYLLSNGSSTAAQGQLQVGDGTAGATAVSGSRTAGALVTVTGVRNVASDNLLVYNDATAGSAVTDATTTTSSFFDTLRIARLGLAGTEYNDAEINAVAVFRSALTLPQIRQIVNYFANREVYL